MRPAPDPTDLKPINPWPLILLLVVVGYVVGKLQGWW